MFDGSDIPSPYGGPFLSPDQASLFNANNIALQEFKPFKRDDVFFNKTIKGVFWLVSQCQALSHREVAVERLSK